MIRTNRVFGFVEVDAAALQAGDDGNSIPSEIEILKAGDWSKSNHGAFVITAADLQEYVTNFKAGVRKGVPIDLEHNVKGGAVGWVQDLKLAGDTLMGTVQWTKTGLGLLQDGAYKFFSPEFWVKGYKDPEGKLAADRNVLVGGALTNRPLFKGLKAIMADDGSQTIYADEGESMTIEDIRKKALTDLTEEDKKFLKENEAQLTDAEKTAYGLKAPIESAADKAAREKKEKEDADALATKAKADADAAAAVKANEDGSFQISASDFAAMKLSAERGEKAAQQLEAMKASEDVAGFIKADDGAARFKPGAVDKLTAFYTSLNEDQRAVFASDIVPNISSQVVMAGEVGTGVHQQVITGADDAAEKIDEKASAFLASDEGKGSSYREALAHVMAQPENAELTQEYIKGRQA